MIKYNEIKNHIKENKLTFFVYSILRLLVIFTMIRQLTLNNYENLFLCILTLLLLIIPTFIQIEFKIEFPSTLEITILLFIFCAEILGEIQSFYIKIQYWDTILHTLNGFLAAAIGFSLVDLLNNENRLEFKMSPLFMSITAFSFSMTIGSCWEIFEFMMDQLFNLDMQKDTIINMITSVNLDATNSNIPVTITNINDVYINGNNLGLGGYLDIGIIDTMHDLIVNFIGAFVFSIFGFFYVKNRDDSSFIKSFIPKKKYFKKKRYDS